MPTATMVFSSESDVNPHAANVNGAERWTTPPFKFNSTIDRSKDSAK